jgi:hypothetical protein
LELPCRFSFSLPRYDEVVDQVLQQAASGVVPLLQELISAAGLHHFFLHHISDISVVVMFHAGDAVPMVSRQLLPDAFHDVLHPKRVHHLGRVPVLCVGQCLRRVFEESKLLDGSRP